MRILTTILLFIHFISLSQDIDSVSISALNSPMENKTFNLIYGDKDSLIGDFRLAPDLIFATATKNNFYQTGISLQYRFQKIGQKGHHWEGNIYSRGGITSNSSIPYFSDPQTKSFFLNPIKDSLFGNPTLYYLDFNGSVSYRIKLFSMNLGMDRPQSGFSYRSLYSSSTGISNPFLSLSLKFNKSISYSFRQDVLREKIAGHFEPKGNVSHVFSYNHKGLSKLQFRLFESVVYQIKDTLYNRGFEVEYLNPILFFRPQEYNLASADNIILGAEFSYVFGRKKNINSLNRTRVYGQLLLDDFLLSAIRARNGWWANKYGINLGLEVSNKTKDSLKTAKKYFVEFTYMRPYVFSQTNPGIVYGNQGLPVGHSLGSNFAELYQEYSYFSFRNHLNIDVFLQAFIKGVDSVGFKSISYGGDIYKSYSKHPYEFNNRVGQGVTLRGIHLGTRFAYVFIKKTFSKNLHFYIEPRFRLLFFENRRQSDIFLSIGIQSSLWRNKDRLNY